ncbi:DUF4190 domain-containing protein [Couchioplanes caeruleus]|uniref:flagellar basal body-associated FliL family protein n=1 Tax=Couchioplanes caeruleus TaxID=56438 RepID=UPI0020C0DF23|nr:flagellar basal body-associated FliL family protein [Couchioplanes caeruleus]UQU62039.1 DUF4190 domain-containing protein [Couchioplanes caeruleus]
MPAQSAPRLVEQADVTQNPYGHDPAQVPAPPPAGAAVLPRPALPTSGMAVASLVLGVVGVLGGWCTFAVPCVLAVVFGYAGLGQTRGGARGGRGMAIAGLVLGVVPVAVIALILVLGGVGALVAPISSMSRAAGERAAPADGPREKGAVVALDAPLTINLADGHYLKLGMALQLDAGRTGPIDTSAAAGLAVDLYTGRSIGELATEQGRAAVKRQHADRTRAAYPGVVIDIYYTTFVTQ